jgi:hypothetical protein
MGLPAKRAATMVLVMVAAAVAGCGSSVHLGGPAAPPPGHQAPANAVSGFVQHLMSGANPVTTCSYVDPREEGNCFSAVGGASKGGTGTWRPGHSVVFGNEAIVAIELGNVCFSSCSTNVNPDAGLPRHGLSFGTAFQHTQGDGPAGRDYAFGCVRVGGRWYVELGLPGLL